MKKKLKEAYKIANHINRLYMKMDEPAWFFDEFHDDMKMQSDCAWEEVGEIDHLVLKEPNTPTTPELIQHSMSNLKQTLKYCKAIIKLQEQAKKLPKSIYG